MLYFKCAEMRIIGAPSATVPMENKISPVNMSTVGLGNFHMIFIL